MDANGLQSPVEQRCSNFPVERQPVALLKMQILLWQVRVDVRGSALLTSLQLMLMMPVLGHTLFSVNLENNSSFVSLLLC